MYIKTGCGIHTGQTLDKHNNRLESGANKPLCEDNWFAKSKCI